MTQAQPGQQSPHETQAAMNVGVNVQIVSFVVASPPGAPLSPPPVRRRNHDAVVALLRAAEAHYDSRWQVARDAYPSIGVHVMGSKGPLIGLLLDAAEFDSCGLGVTLTDPKFRVLVVGVPAKTTSDHPPLVYSGEPGAQRAWFCLPGTREFHRQYADLEPFSLIRDRSEAHPVAILMRCLDAIDVDALERASNATR